MILIGVNYVIMWWGGQEKAELLVKGERGRGYLMRVL